MSGSGVLLPHLSLTRRTGSPSDMKALAHDLASDVDGTWSFSAHVGGAIADALHSECPTKLDCVNVEQLTEGIYH